MKAEEASSRFNVTGNFADHRDPNNNTNNSRKLVSMRRRSTLRDMADIGNRSMSNIALAKAL